MATTEPASTATSLDAYQESQGRVSRLSIRAYDATNLWREESLKGFNVFLTARMEEGELTYEQTTMVRYLVTMAYQLGRDMEHRGGSTQGNLFG